MTQSQSWKGRSFTQITSSIQKNKNTMTNTKGVFSSLPMKTYRRELFSTTATRIKCNPRTSLTIDNMNTPNGAFKSSSTTCNGINTTMDADVIKTTNQLNEKCCSTFNQQTNALTRMRRSNITTTKYNAKNAPTHFVGTKERFKARNMGFEQNSCFCPATNNSNVTKLKKQHYPVTAENFAVQRKYDAVNNVASSFTAIHGKHFANMFSYKPNETNTPLNFKQELPLKHPHYCKNTNSVTCQ